MQIIGLIIDKRFFIRNNYIKKKVRFDNRARKEFLQLPKAVQEKVSVLIDLLERDGVLIEPYGKKIDAHLFEIRVKVQGLWRLLYAYILVGEIIILSVFQKKTQKTPIKEIKKAKKRLQEYQL